MTIRKRGSGWTVYRQIAKSVTTRKEAERFNLLLESGLADVTRQFEAEIRPCCRIRDKLTEFLSDCKIGLRRRACNDRTLKLHRKRLLTFDAAFHSKALDCIGREDVENWMRRRMRVKNGEPGVIPETVNAEMVSLRAFARWAQEKGYAPPALAFMVVGRLRSKGIIAGTNRKPPKALEMAEMLRLVAMVKEKREDVGLLLEGMLLFCLRPYALCRLLRRDLKLPGKGEPGSLKNLGLKGFHDRDLSITPGTQQYVWAESCIGLFKRLHGRAPAGHDPLITHQTRRKREPYAWTTAALDNSVRLLCRQMNVHFTPYQIRHTAISWLHLNPGISPGATQAAAAHASITTQDIYGKRRGGEAAPAFDALSLAVEQYRQMEKGGDQGGGVLEV